MSYLYKIPLFVTISLIGNSVCFIVTAQTKAVFDPEIYIRKVDVLRNLKFSVSENHL